MSCCATLFFPVKSSFSLYQLVFLNGIRNLETLLSNLMINLKNKLIQDFWGLLEVAGVCNIHLVGLGVILVQTLYLLKE